MHRSPGMRQAERPPSLALADVAAAEQWDTAGCGGPYPPYAPRLCLATTACGTACNPACRDDASPQMPRHGSSGTCSGSTLPSPPHPAPDADHDSSRTTSCPQTSACTCSTTALQTG